MGIKEFADNAIGKVENGFMENRPAIFIFAGTAALVGAGVIASVSTYKNRKLFNVIKQEKKTLKEAKASIGSPLPEDESVIFTKKEFYTHYAPKSVIKIAKKIARMYSIPFAMAIAGIFGIVAGYVEEHNRYLDAAELAATVMASFAAYRQSVVKNYGQEADDICMGFEKIETETPVLDKDGNPKVGKDGQAKVNKEVKYILNADEFERISPIAFIWGEYNIDGTVNGTYSPEDDQYNKSHIESLEAAVGRRVYESRKQYCTYNDIRDMFDVPKTKYMNLGYHKNSPLADKEIKFRPRKIQYRIPALGDQIIDGYLIDPNIVGDISKYFDTDPEDFRNNTYERIH